jgi:hypothetical protein
MLDQYVGWAIGIFLQTVGGAAEAVPPEIAFNEQHIGPVHSEIPECGDGRQFSRIEVKDVLVFPGRSRTLVINACVRITTQSFF